MKVDSKGRISIPAFLRRNFDLNEGSEVILSFDLETNAVLLVFYDGQCGVAESMEACGASGAGATPAAGPGWLKTEVKPWKTEE